MIPKILSTPVAIARSAAFGAVRLGFSGVVAVAGKIIAARASHPAPSTDSSPTGTAEPVIPRPSPVATPAPAPAAKKATAKKAPAKKAPAKKAPAKKAPASGRGPRPAAKKSPVTEAPSVPPTPADVAAHSKPAAVLNEDIAPVDDDPVVYTSGPS